VVRIGARECQVVRILAADGSLLTLATAGPLAEEGTLPVDDVDEPGALIDYYFGRGQRVVLVEHDGTTLEGTLDTRWRMIDRAWWVALNRPRAIPSLVPLPTHEEAAVQREAIPDDAREREEALSGAPRAGAELALAASGTPAG